MYVSIFKADTYNWHLSQADVKNESICKDQSEDWGTGGFAPFGFSGIIHGAATCFFGFIGFDVIATTGKFFLYIFMKRKSLLRNMAI